MNLASLCNIKKENLLSKIFYEKCGLKTDSKLFNLQKISGDEHADFDKF